MKFIIIMNYEIMKIIMKVTIRQLRFHIKLQFCHVFFSMYSISLPLVIRQKGYTFINHSFRLQTLYFQHNTEIDKAAIEVAS